LEFVQKAVDTNYFSVAERSCLTILGQPTGNVVNELFYTTVDQNHNLVVSVYKSLQAQQVKLLDFSESISVYYPLSDIMISTGTGVYYLNESGADEWVRDKEWIRLAQENSSGHNGWQGLRSIEKTALPGNSLNVFTYVCNGPKLQQGTRGLLALNIDERVIRSALDEAMLSSKGTLILVDRSGNILSHPEQERLYSSIAEEPWFESVIGQDQFTSSFRIDDSEMVVSAVRSNYLDMHYVYLVGTETYYQPSALVNRTLKIILICFLFAGIAFAACCAYISAAPIRQLGRKAQEVYGHAKGARPEVTDLDQIEDIFDEMDSQLRYLDNVITENRSVVKNTVLTNLLLGNTTADRNSESLIRFAGITFEEGFFAVAAVRVSKGVLAVSAEYAADVIFAAVSEFISQIDAARAAVMIDQTTVGVIMNSSQEHAAEEATEQLAEHLSGLIRIPEVLIPFHIGVGQNYPALEELSVSFRDAVEALSYAELLPDRVIFRYSEFSQRASSVPRELVEAVTGSLKKENAEFGGITELKEYLRSAGSIEVYRKTKAQIVDEIEKLISRYGSKKDAKQLVQMTKALQNAENLDEFTDGIEAILQNSSEINPANLLYTSRAKEYTQNHLNAPLSAEEMARMLNISSSHFSRVFKSTCGENYSEYVARIRMEEAVRMIRETNLPVRTIAEAIGYGENIGYFSRKFKSIYGITPSEYRREQALNDPHP
ncbi:MAG: helix-turn-helix domain-containing protein, partial [Firmicutes bacterium]|nr:helix-turn-helix domain-containing protein [Bacillota bacterium]